MRRFLRLGSYRHSYVCVSASKALPSVQLHQTGCQLKSGGRTVHIPGGEVGAYVRGIA
jgi:hypothetical protein